MSETGERRVATTGGDLAVVDAGDAEAPPIVLLSGGFTSSHLWRHVVPMLAPWMRVVAPDLLGSGGSDAPAGADLSLVAHARRVREVLDALGIARFALVGHGHGGGVAQLVATSGRAEALVLVDTIAFDAWPAPGVRALREALAAGEAIDAEGWVRSMVASAVARPERLADADIDGYVRPFAGPDGARRFALVASSFDGAGLADLEGRLGGLEIPTLILWGEDDAFVDVALAERLGDVLPWASVALLPRCGHLLFEDAAETVAPLLFQWLRMKYLKVEHAHERGPVTVYLGRRPPGEGG
ncbi:MAG: alpha/beta fold hydrolase [Actinomycetota bacterium]